MTTRRQRLTAKERETMFRLWREGCSFAEIAKKFGTYRQKPRSVVMSFKPSFEDYRRHDHFRRLNQFRSLKSR